MFAVIDWPFLVIAVLVGALLLSVWAERRLAKACNLAWAAGDVALCLDLALRLQRSWLPTVIMSRRSAVGNLGNNEAVIAERYQFLCQPGEALRWARSGLRIARRPAPKACLHAAAARACVDLGEHESMACHLTALGETLEHHPHPELSHDALCVSSHLQAGRVDEALSMLLDVVDEGRGAPHRQLFACCLEVLRAAGRFVDVLTLTAWMLEMEGGPLRDVAARVVDPARARVGTADVMRFDMLLQEVGNVCTALSAAADAGRWDLFERYLQRLSSVQSPAPWIQQSILGKQAIWAAHCGRRDEVVGLLDAMDKLATRYPRDPRLRLLCCWDGAQAWQLLGEHEHALAALAALPQVVFPPLDRSWLASVEASSLAALGRDADARSKREEAAKLAPGAFWNRPRDAWSIEGECDGPIVDLSLRLYAVPTPAATVSMGNRPVEPVASGVASAAWILAVAAMVPVLGILPGLALAVLSILLLAKRAPLLHDRRVGRAGLVLSLLSIGFAAMSFAGWVRFRGPTRAAGEASAIVIDIDSGEGEDGRNAFDAGPSTHEDVWRASEEAGEAVTDDVDEGEIRGFDEEPPLSEKVLYFAVLIAAIVFHEVGHGVAALWSGDPTARDRGRFSLNPMQHMDWIGSVAVPVVLFLAPGNAIIGWAKPVPINPALFRRPRAGQLGVAMAGVSLNLLIAFAATNVLMVILLLIRWWYPGASLSGVVMPLTAPSLEGVPNPAFWATAISVCKAAVWINAILAGFNLLPFPPLDGFWVIRALAPRRVASLLGRLGGAGMMILLGLIAFKLLHYLLMPALLLGLLLLEVALLLAG